jgi:hypothetical protein
MNFINCFLFSIYKLACWETSSSNLHLWKLERFKFFHL